MKKKILSTICFVLLVSLSTAQQKNTDSSNDSTVATSHFEIEAAFPTGNTGWNRYLYSSFSKVDFASFFPSSAAGNCISFKMSFIVSETGRLINIENKSKEEIPPLLLTEIKKIFAASPLWRPAVNKGRSVNSYRQQSFSITLAQQ